MPKNERVVPRLVRGIQTESAASLDPAIKSRDDGLLFLYQKSKCDDYIVIAPEFSNFSISLTGALAKLLNRQSLKYREYSCTLAQSQLGDGLVTER